MSVLNSPKLQYYKDGKKHVHILGQPSVYEQIEKVETVTGVADLQIKENVKYYYIEVTDKTTIKITPEEQKESYIQTINLIINMKKVSPIIFPENVQFSISSLLNSRKEYIIELLVLGEKILGYVK